MLEKGTADTTLSVSQPQYYVTQRGKNGKNGKEGKKGKDGRDGRDGKDGKDGTSTNAQEVSNLILPQLLAQAQKSIQNYTAQSATAIDDKISKATNQSLRALNGSKATPITAQEIREKLESLKNEQRALEIYLNQL